MRNILIMDMLITGVHDQIPVGFDLLYGNDLANHNNASVIDNLAEIMVITRSKARSQSASINNSIILNQSNLNKHIIVKSTVNNKSKVVDVDKVGNKDNVLSTLHGAGYTLFNVDKHSTDGSLLVGRTVDKANSQVAYWLAWSPRVIVRQL